MGSCLVTGARGFVAAWLTKALLEQGHEVVTLDVRPTTEQPACIEMLGIAGDVAQVTGSVADSDLVTRTLAEHRVDTVFHLGAETIVQTVQADPVRGFESNVQGTWVVLEACRHQGVERVVFASSDKAYGANPDLPYKEDYPLLPTAPYEASKAAADLIARSYWTSYGLPVAVTRFANIYGGGDLNFSRLIPEAVSAAIRGRAPVLRSDGSPERDFLYVEDAANAYLHLAAELHRDDVRGQAFNAGGGTPYSVGQVVRMISEIAGGLEPIIEGTGNPEGEIDRQWVDPAKFKAVCGWEPKVGLEEGLRRTVEWAREHPESLAP